MKLAICDDEDFELNKLYEYVKEYDETIEPILFSSAADLFAASQKDFFDIVFLDIEMDDPNGYDVACELTKAQDKPLIIFITKSGEYTVRGYGVAFRYIRKPILYQTFSAVLKLAISEVVPQKFSLALNGRTYVISVKDIEYFEIFGHELSVHTTKGTYICRTTLNEVISLFKGTHFAQPHKSYFVNLAYVDCIDSRDITMSSKDRIPISMLRRDDFRKQFQQYLRRA